MIKKRPIALVNGDILFSQKIKNGLEGHSFWELSIDCSLVERFFEQSNFADPPAILLLAGKSEGVDNIEFIHSLKQVFPSMVIVVLIPHMAPGILAKILQCQVHGIYDQTTDLSELWKAMAYAEVVKSPLCKHISVDQFKTLYPSQKTVARPDLSLPEVEVILYLLQGHSYPMIAKELAVHIDTIRNYIKSIYQKLDIHSKRSIFTLFPLLNR